jgi:transposase
MTLDAALRALHALPSTLPAEARTAIEGALVSREAETQRLRLRVQDLEQQLAQRKGPVPVAPAHPSLFGDQERPAPMAAGRRPSRTRPDATRPPQPRGRKPLDPALPRELIRLPDPPVAERVDPFTGAVLQPGFTEVLEVLARKPAVYVVRRYERTVWVSATKSAPVTTPWPADVLSRSGVHTSVVAHIAAAHFVEHVPYYRLEQQLARTGVALPRSTQVSLMARLDALVAPVVAGIRARVLASGYVHLDATPLDLCDRTRPGTTQSASVWTFRARSRDPATHGLVWFDFQLTKSPTHPGAILRAAQYRGVVQTDGASGLDTLAPPEQIRHLGCLAHARRYVVEAEESGDTRAVAYRVRVDRLFRIEARARRALAGQPDDARRARVATWRDRFSVPLIDALLYDAATDQVSLPPKTPLAIALGYWVNQRASLRRCVTTPDASLDNNPAENALRPLKLGMRNWLFIGHPDAGPRLANLFTLLENCRQAGVDAEAYVSDLLHALAANTLGSLDQWLPRAWQERRRSGVTT